MWTAGALLVAFAALGVVVAILARRAEPYLRARIVQELSDRLHARVELDSFKVSVGNGFHGRWGVLAEGRGLRIWPSEQVEAARALQLAAQSLPPGAGEPLIELNEFNFHAPIRYDPSRPLTISLVRLTGLSIHVPPKSQRVKGTAPSSSTPAPQPGSANSGRSGIFSSIVVEAIECENAQLVIETDKPNKLPLGFSILHLRLTHITANDPIHYTAQVVNPRPAGLINATGTFGPLQTDDLGGSPVAGDYRLEHADLATFKGISGSLSSTGHFEGNLRNIIVDGDADVPDFSLSQFLSPVLLKTHFHARVDGTDGDTWLEPVNASIGHSSFTTSGQIVRLKTLQDEQGTASAIHDASLLAGGHDISLNINIDQGHIDDFIRLTSQTRTPLLTGTVSVKAKLHIPPGKVPVIKRLTLEGDFKLDDAKFTEAKIQDRVNELSQRGQGEKKTDQPDEVTSQMQSDFQVANAVVTLPNLIYTVPGAVINLHGTYGLDGALSFEGFANMEATVSKMVGGWKGLLLKPADRFFKKGGAGAQFPIHVSGTREAPKFGVDFNKFKSTHPQRPDEQPAQPAQPEQPVQPAGQSPPPQP
jgi:hypothetical protein